MTPDITIQNHGSIFLFVPHTETASQWIADHLPEDRIEYTGGVAVEHRYARDLAAGMLADGLKVE